MSTEQKQNLDAILRQSAFPAGVTVTAAAPGGIPTAEITVDGIEPRHVVLYFHGGVYVLEDAFQVAGLAAQVGRRPCAKVIFVDYRLSRELLQPRVTDYTAEHDPAAGLAAVADADAAVTLDITPGVPHVFQAFYPILDEAAAALDRAGQLLSAHLASAERVTA